MRIFDNTFLLRFALMIVMIMHGIPSFITMSVIDFGGYLSSIFGSLGTPLAVTIKLVHVISIPALLFNRYLKLLSVLNIIIFLMGIIMVHGSNGWYVVGGGTDGVEYNVLLIFCFLTFIFPDGFIKGSEAPGK